MNLQQWFITFAVY